MDSSDNRFPGHYRNIFEKLNVPKQHVSTSTNIMKQDAKLTFKKMRKMERGEIKARHML